MTAKNNLKIKCPDCLECQMCVKERCHQCKKGGHIHSAAELGPFITHGEFMEWKRKRSKTQPWGNCK